MFISDSSFWVNSKNKYSSTAKIKCGVPRVARQILSSNSRVFKGSPGYFLWIFQGLYHLDSRVFQDIMQKIRNFPGIRIKKCLLEHRKKNTTSLFKNPKILCFFFNLCSNRTNKLINQQHFFKTSYWGFPSFFVVQSRLSCQQAFSVGSIVWSNKSHEAFIL